MGAAQLPPAELTAPAPPAPDAVAPPPGHPRFPLMDSLRALAALGVIVTHVTVATGIVEARAYGTYLANLDVGVSVFFVLSGFLLYRPFFNAELTGAPMPRPGEYARRRLLRIVPAYWLALTVLAVYPGLVGVFSADWWRYYGLVQIYDPFTDLAGLSVAWTLCIEVSFYAALPVYAAATRRAGRNLTPAGRIRLQLLVLGALAAGSLALRALDHGTVMQNSLLTHLDWFALGMTLAVLSVAADVRARPSRPFLHRRPAVCWTLAAATYVVMCMLLSGAPQHLYYTRSQAFAQHLLRGVVATLLVLPAVFGWWSGGWPRAVLGWRWVARLGVISYGLYLWHEPILQTLAAHGVQRWWLNLALTLALTTVCAALSYRCVERPVLRFKNRVRPLSGSPTGADAASVLKGSAEPPSHYTS